MHGSTPARAADGIRLRGTAVTRLEAFTDAAFAFTLTLLVIATAGVAAASVVLALALRPLGFGPWSAAPGVAYFLVGLASPWAERRVRRRRAAA